MWAGNQPFLEQPIVRLVDAGGNTVERENCGTVEAVLTRSLSQRSEIRIDTSQDDIPMIESVQFDISHITDGETRYTAGHNISIIITFTQEVSVIVRPGFTITERSVPSLELNVLDENGSRSKAYLLNQNHNMSPSRRLHFLYTVSRGPITSDVDIFSRTSLELNGCLLVDAWQRNVAILLPSLDSTHGLLASKNITVHSEPAIITNFSTSVGSGEYGAGHMIAFVVKFNVKVRTSCTVQ